MFLPLFPQGVSSSRDKTKLWRNCPKILICGLKSSDVTKELNSKWRFINERVCLRQKFEFQVKL